MRKSPDGASVADHLALAAQWGSAPAQQQLEEAPDLPVSVGHLWWWFCDLSRRRGGAGYGPAPLSFHDLECWSRVTGTKPTHWESDVILRLDDEWLSAEADRQQEEIDRSKREGGQHG